MAVLADIEMAEARGAGQGKRVFAPIDYEFLREAQAKQRVPAVREAPESRAGHVRDIEQLTFIILF